MIAVNKSFDCVEMKWAIQKGLRKEYAGMTAKEKYRLQKKRISSNPILSRFLHNATPADKQVV